MFAGGGKNYSYATGVGAGMRAAMSATGELSAFCHFWTGGNRGVVLKRSGGRLKQDLDKDF